MKITNFKRIFGLLLTLGLVGFLVTSCEREIIGDELDGFKTSEIQLNGDDIVQKLSNNDDFLTGFEIRQGILNDLVVFYLENTLEIESDKSVFTNYYSELVNSRESELNKVRINLRKQFPDLFEKSADEFSTLIRSAEEFILESDNKSYKNPCRDFCHDQYLSCDQSCYDRYLYFPNFTFQDYLDCNGNCITFVWNTCLRLCGIKPFPG